MDVVVESYVTHVEGHDAGIGNIDGALHVGTVRAGEEFDGELGYVEALESVEACACFVSMGIISRLSCQG